MTCRITAPGAMLKRVVIGSPWLLADGKVWLSVANARPDESTNTAA